MKAIVIALLCLSAAYAVKVESSEMSLAATSTGGPADLLLDHLDEIEVQIRLEQAEHQKLYDSQKAECDEEIDARTTAIVDGEDAYKRASAHYIRCESSLHEAEADLAAVRAYQTEIKANVQSLTMNREAEHKAFDTLINEELNPAIAAVQGAYPIIDEFANSETSFVQVTKHMTKMFKSLVKAGHGAMMAAPLTAFASMSQEFAAEDIAEVRRLFEQLEADLVNARNEAVKTEEGRVQVFEATIAEYASIQEKLATTEAQLVQYSSDMQSCTVQEQAIMDSAQTKVSNNKQALAYAVQMCTAFEDEFNNATQGRNAELELLAKLKEFIREQEEIFGDYGAEEEDVFDSYKSNYESGVQSQVDMFIQMRTEKTKEHRDRMTQAMKTPEKSKKNRDKLKKN